MSKEKKEPFLIEVNLKHQQSDFRKIGSPQYLHSETNIDTQQNETLFISTFQISKTDQLVFGSRSLRRFE